MLWISIVGLVCTVHNVCCQQQAKTSPQGRNYFIQRYALNSVQNTSKCGFISRPKLQKADVKPFDWSVIQPGQGQMCSVAPALNTLLISKYVTFAELIFRIANQGDNTFLNTYLNWFDADYCYFVLLMGDLSMNIVSQQTTQA